MKMYEKFKSIPLDYRELSFVMGIPTKESKELFQDALPDLKKITIQDQLPASVLMVNFGESTSVDQRYDKVNLLLFNLYGKAKQYKKHLNDLSAIKKKKFTGGKSVFYKVCEPEAIQEIEDNLKYKYKYLYDSKSPIGS